MQHVTESQSPAVFEILGSKRIGVTSLIDLSGSRDVVDHVTV